MTKQAHVYLVEHSYEKECGCAETKTIGIFASRKDATAAVVQLRTQPGFREHPRKFHIARFDLGTTWWREGFG